MAMLKWLISIRLSALFPGRGKRARTKGMGRAGVAAVVALLSLLVAFYMFMVSSMLAEVLIPRGYVAPYFAIFNLLGFSVVFMLSIFEVKSHLFECGDNELLLSMPIRPRDIVLSRALSVIILNIGESLVFALPAAISALIYGAKPWYIITATVAAVFVALLATALSCAAGYLVAAISARLRHNTLVSVLLSLVFLGLYFGGYGMLIGSLESLQSDAGAAADAMASAFSGISFIGEISIGNPIVMPIFVVISVGLSMLAWIIISKNYIKIITSKPKVEKKLYVKEELRMSGAFIAVAKKELALFSSSATYILNAGLGALFQVALSIMLLFGREQCLAVTEQLALIGLDKEAIYVAVGAILAGLGSMVTISASSISMEGKNYWIMKTSPISTEQMLYAKLVPHLALTMPSALISGILASIALELSAVWWVFVIFTSLVSSAAFAMLGLILNIAMPKLDYDSVVRVVKQSMPVFILSLGGMLLTLLLSTAAIFLSVLIGPLAAAASIAALFVAFFLAMYLVLCGPAVKKLERISP